MAEYIDREMAIDLFYTVDPENDGTDGSTEIRKTANYGSEEIESMLSDLPTADVVPVRHARWNRPYISWFFPLKIKDSYCYCTYCGNPVNHRKTTNYCSYCGAIMDGGKYVRTETLRKMRWKGH